MKKTIGKGRSKIKDIGSIAIKRLWGDAEVIDAKVDLRVMIIPEDVKKATRTDPGCCVFAQACMRSFGATKVLFFRRVAYVELPDKLGTLHVERFHLPGDMRNLIAAFDRGEETIPKAGFLLKAPTESQTFEGVRRNNNTKRIKRKMLLGSAESNQGRGKYVDKPIVIDLTVRSGIGAVHFVPGMKPVQAPSRKSRGRNKPTVIVTSRGLRDKNLPKLESTG